MSLTLEFHKPGHREPYGHPLLDHERFFVGPFPHEGELPDEARLPHPHNPWIANVYGLRERRDDRALYVFKAARRW